MDKPPDKQVAYHPKISVMVITAITALEDKKGSSLHAINKYINANYNADAKKLSVYIKKYLKKAVEEGELLQPTGRGALGSFKINKQKVSTEPKVLKVKSSKQPTLVTSTPKKTLKPKKAFTSGKSPVRRKNSVVDEEGGTDTTFTKPNTKMPEKPKVPNRNKNRKSRVSIIVKVQKPKKVMANKVKEKKVDFSMKGKLDTTAIVPKLKKYNDSPYPKAKKSAKPAKSAASVAKKIKAED